jgi:hypothetical protein
MQLLLHTCFDSRNVVDLTIENRGGFKDVMTGFRSFTSSPGGKIGFLCLNVYYCPEWCVCGCWGEKIPNCMRALTVRSCLREYIPLESLGMRIQNNVLSLSFLLVISTNSVSCWSLWITTINEWRRQLCLFVEYPFGVSCCVWFHLGKSWLSIIVKSWGHPGWGIISVHSKTSFEGIMVLMREELECSNPWTPNSVKSNW